ncbi:MAG: winged helix-turn-helix transcriptional regulator [Solirubrobacterales bacterium]|nr:winged helix-turn-helix transcriptional regulator [Solirubrobacterales bacterium]
MAEFIDVTVKDIDERLAKLKQEVTRLEAARSALVGRGPGRPRGSRARSGRTRARRTTTRRRGRRGTRATQALEIVRAHPGITIPELAKEIKIAPNYLYRVLPPLAEQGLIKRDGNGWHPA